MGSGSPPLPTRFKFAAKTAKKNLSTFAIFAVHSLNKYASVHCAVATMASVWVRS
jgi:hypothetical protein